MHALILARADPNVALPSAAISTAPPDAQAGRLTLSRPPLTAEQRREMASQAAAPHHASNAHAGVAAVLLSARCDPEYPRTRTAALRPHGEQGLRRRPEGGVALQLNVVCLSML
jgi:hypothetical protein